MDHFNDEEEMKVEATRDQLIEDVGKGRKIEDLINSPGGQMLIKHLKDQFVMYVLASVNESQKYKSACRAIEETLGFMGITMSAGKAAEKLFEDMRDGKVDVDY
jgi:hypothetical protein